MQSARWPSWAESAADTDKVLKLIGYGIPSLEKASRNSEKRVTLITPDAEILPSKLLHLYTVRIPDELRNAALEAKIRLDVTLAYTALPRRTRARRTGYLETWLDEETSKLGEPRDAFLARMQATGREENERAWKVPAAERLANGCNLDRKNPRAKEDITRLPPAHLAADILKKEQRIAEIMGNIRNLLAKHDT